MNDSAVDSLDIGLPNNSDVIKDWKWTDYKDFFIELEKIEINRENVNKWLKTWSNLNELIGEIGTSLYIGTTVDTTDEKMKEKYYEFLEGINEPASTSNQRLKKKFLVYYNNYETFKELQHCNIITYNSIT